MTSDSGEAAVLLANNSGHPMHGDEVIVLLQRLRCAVAADAVLHSLEKLKRAYKANFDPNQPRVPAGNSDGGQWTSTGGGGSTSGGSGRNDPRVLSDAMPDDEWKPGAQYAQRRPPGGVRPVQINGRWVQPPAAQSYRLANAEAQADRAIARVRTLDPNWRPKRGSYESVEGLIRETQARAREAEARFEQLRAGIGGNFGPPLTPPPRGASSGQHFDGPSWIAVYRVAHSRRDLFGNQVGLSEQDTVAAAEFNGRTIFGTNSDSLPYTGSDRAVAQRYVDRMVKTYPEIMSGENVGRIPNNALYHAESTILLRAARESGGTLAGRALEVHVDRLICPSCETVLPKLGLELGNPTVTFVGRRYIYVMQDGRWISKRRK